MYCKKCGKYNSEGSQICKYCGSRELSYFSPSAQGQGNNNSVRNAGNSSERQGESKTGIGIILAIFLGLFGLIIGLLLYPWETYERETFLSAWVKCFIICLIVIVVLSLAIVLGTCAALR